MHTIVGTKYVRWCSTASETANGAADVPPVVLTLCASSASATSSKAASAASAAACAISRSVAPACRHLY